MGAGCQDPRGGGSWQCPFSDTRKSSNAPPPTLLGPQPSRGVTAEPAFLRSCSKELGRSLRHPCLVLGRKLSPRVYARAAAMPVVITQDHFPPLSSWPGRREELGSLSPEHSSCWLPPLAACESWNFPPCACQGAPNVVSHTPGEGEGSSLLRIGRGSAAGARSPPFPSPSSELRDPSVSHTVWLGARPLPSLGLPPLSPPLQPGAGPLL